MRTSIILGIVMLCLNLKGKAQVDSVNIAFNNKLFEIFENIDYDQVPSGILYDRGTPFITFEPFKGQITPDSKANPMIFGLAYASLTSMTVREDAALPGSSVLRTLTDTVDPNSEIIPILGMHQVYHYIDSLALEDSLLTQDGDNIADVIGRSRSPYIQDEIFMFTATEVSVNSASFSLFFDSAHFYNNTGKTVDSLYIDLGNGQGYLLIDFDQNIPVLFTESGMYPIKVKVVYTDASVYESHFDLIVSQSALRGVGDMPDITHYIYPQASTEENPARGGGKISVFLACGHERIEKPFIWAEAYNPALGIVQANLDDQQILERLAHPDGIYDDKSLLEYLEENGYDIIILDYARGTDFLGNTAEFIKESLRWVNAEKRAAGSNAKNVLLGQSMGGVSSMQALREMENDDEDHETETFIVFDSPIRGVNVPLAAQASLLDIATLWVNKPWLTADNEFLYQFVEPVRDIIHLLYEPATRTMLNELNTDVHINGGGPEVSAYIAADLGISVEHLYTAHYDYLHGEMGGMPENCDVIVMANGSYNGQNQPYLAGERILHADANFMVLASIIAGYFDEAIAVDGLRVFRTRVMTGGIGIVAWAVGATMTIDIEMYAMKNEPNFVYYSSHFHWHPFWSLDGPIVYSSNEVKTSDGLEIDHISGGFFGLENNGLFFDDEPFAEAVPVFKLHTWCFTPVGSVLNYENITTGANWQQEPLGHLGFPETMLENNYMKGVDMYYANVLDVTFDNDPDVEREWSNTAHTWFTSEQTHFMHFFLNGQNELYDVSEMFYGTTFNYGKAEILPSTDYYYTLPVRTSAILEQSLVVNNTTFNVNANEIIGLTPNAYGAVVLGNAIPNSHFVMNLGPICNPTPKVHLELEEGAIMDIGDGNTRTGSVLVEDGHQITVRSGAILHIKAGSTLKLNEGGLLYVENGGTVIIDGILATVAGSEFHFFEGAAIQLNGEDARLNLQGMLHLHENADFHPTHVDVNSGIILIDNPDGTLIAETGSKFRIMGDTDTDPMLAILENGKLIAPLELDEFFINSCQVTFLSTLDLPLQSYTRFTCTNVVFNAESNLEEAWIHPKIGLFSKSFITNSSFTDVVIYAEEMLPADGYFLVLKNTPFDFTYKKGDYFLDMPNGNVSINNCTFQNYLETAVRLNGLTAYGIIANSEFTAAITAPNAISVFKLGENELALKNNNFFAGKIGVYTSQGQLSLRCNNFSTINQDGIFSGYNGRLEMSQNFKQGYNFFDNIDGYNVKLHRGNFLSISNGYNYFWDNGSTAIIEGTLNLDLPGALVIPGAKNQWNASNTAPSASDVEVYTFGTTDEIPYNTSPTMSGTCGTYDPSRPPIIVVDSQSGINLPKVNLPGFAGMRLDSAYSEAVSNTVLWNPTKNDAQAIGYFHAILTKNYTQQELARPETRYFLDQSYAAMKYTLGHAVSDSTILRTNNKTSFDATVQKYVDVLNLLTQEDTFDLVDYHKRFALELDKANLFRMLGHTETGLDILQNISLCQIDSSERVALNELMAIYENEAIKRAIGTSAYGVDTVYVNIANYTTPSSSQATEFYFGSVINSLSSISFRTCNSGSLMPDDDSRATSFLLYPNPSEGVINLKYEIPSESNAELVVYSMNGQVIYRGNLVDGSNTETIDISKVESGLYFYTVLYNGVFEHAGRISIAH